ncbi:MAG: hypothetical protein HGB35_07315, partial [Geobacteraceae bacterium]|nr:hypothetical protein [Geobacteraceae bacterium]
AEGLRVAKSIDSGVTWAKSQHAVAPTSKSYIQAGIAVSQNAANPKQKIVHAVWSDSGMADGVIFYSWADAANLDDWNTPVHVNEVSSIQLEKPTIAVSPTGRVAIKGKGINNNGNLYVMTAEGHKEMFTQPQLVTPAVNGDAEMSFDATGNLHLAYPWATNTENMTGIRYTKLPATSNSWSESLTVLATTSGSGNNTSIAVFNSSNIYVATILNGNLAVFSTTNGGASWTSNVVFHKSATVSSTGYVDIAVNANKDLTVGTAFEIAGTTSKIEGRFFRSTDGLIWSAPTVIANIDRIYIGSDRNGKAIVISQGTGEFQSAVYSSKEK